MANGHPPVVRLLHQDYRDLSLPQDHEYVTHSRENMLGRRLEEVQTGREDRLPLVPPTLEPFRQLVRENKWLGGDQPNYADYRALAVFLWTASIATHCTVDSRRSPARLARSRLRPLRRPRAPSEHAYAVWFEVAPGGSRTIHQAGAERRPRQPQPPDPHRPARRRKESRAPGDVRHAAEVQNNVQLSGCRYDARLIFLRPRGCI